ncbi:hypothetical protein CO058_01765 [candidate division WWE3 bacterium CG_4_9_14_0_2_um_filter_35_11]|uniref:MalT-like TPR region domain-containing protein n=1 Tax=candidate division WWE3 bacterium CG_4_9_14_0_2_um_filter_35_11 TaxID=1975077 RepID=A0A2M8ELZ0_UNCKA|nr:MAG: hypothetical protein COV25_03800 [candidate division WWE3 bacterium CG10_big_fil_rev_8_21_14_0_10_35_32]PJC23752.1 MAG: hypothetical protein CO058_01765 [candidate division WWE3 bacterium CG_4_9_14_0_2_um_filter_35_11]
MTNTIIEDIVKLRESGLLSEALSKVNDLLTVHEESNNKKGLIEALGHKRLVLNHIAEAKASKHEKESVVKEMLEVAGKAIEIAEKEFSGDKEMRALLNMHLADALTSYSEHSKTQSKEDILQNALELVTKSIRDLGGSKAHKAWGLNKKAQIHHLLGETKDAIETLKKAEQAIFDGYDEEIKTQKDGIAKIKTWLTGIWLTYSQIAKDNGKKELANLYANAVKNQPDPEKTLVLRKKQAGRILHE